MVRSVRRSGGAYHNNALNIALGVLEPPFDLIKTDNIPNGSTKFHWILDFKDIIIRYNYDYFY